MTDITRSNDGVVKTFKDLGNNTHAETVASTSVPYAEIIDTTTSATYYYHCEAEPGSATSAAVWRISRLTVATGQEMWADGNANFDNIADNRHTTQVYS